MSVPTQYLADNGESFEHDLCQLLSIPSVSADTRHAEDVLRASQWMADKFRYLGFEVEVVPTVCPKCGSAERTAYDQNRRVDQNGRLPDGRKYRAIIWRRCKCSACGQDRSEKTYIVVESRLTNLG